MVRDTAAAWSRSASWTRANCSRADRYSRTASDGAVRSRPSACCVLWNAAWATRRTSAAAAADEGAGAGGRSIPVPAAGTNNKIYPIAPGWGGGEGMIQIKRRRVGLLTGGGGAPGLNAVIRAVVQSLARREIGVVGFHDGFEGLVHSR